MNKKRLFPIFFFCAVAALCFLTSANITAMERTYGSRKHHGAFENSPRVDPYMPAGSLGDVHYHALPGDFSNGCGVMHVFFKCLKTERLRVRGFVHFEPTGTPRRAWDKGNLQFAGDQPTYARLNMSLLHRKTAVQRNIGFQFLAPDSTEELTPPQFFFEVRGTASSALEFSLTFHGVPRMIHLDLCLQEARPSSSGHGHNSTVAVLIPWARKEGLEAHPVLVATFLSHHLQLGLDRVVLFLRSAHKAAYLRNPAWLDPVRSNVIDGSLSLVEWDGQLAQPLLDSERIDDYFDQTVMYNYAILAFWGTPTRLLLTDIDEFLLLQPQATLGALQSHGCLSTISGCMDISRRAYSPGGNAASIISADFDDHAWGELRRKYGFSGVGNLVATLTSPENTTEPLGKLLVDPNSIVSMHIHLGFACEEGALPCDKVQACSPVPEECVSILHNRNMMCMRGNRPESECT